MDNFKNLRIWQDSVKLTVDIYHLINKLPNTEKYGLSSQLGRSSNSTGANIAESCGRFHYKDRINFLYTARASLYETCHHLNIACELGYIGREELNSFETRIKDLNIKINNYIKSSKDNLGSQ